MMQISGVLPDLSAVLPPVRSPVEFKLCGYLDSKSVFTPNKISLVSPKLEVGQDKCRKRSFKVRASGNSDSNLTPVAPFRLQSPVGQLLTQILQTHPHLLLSTVDQQLESLQIQRDAQKDTTAPSSQDLLYKRIAEVQENDRKKTLEEIIYCVIVQKFLDNNISMIPQICTPSDPSERVDLWPNQEQKLESVHSAEAFDMILSHLALVLGERVVEPLETVIQINKIKLGKLYAASIMYGYFLRRVDERYQLERSMETLPEGFGEETPTVVYEEPVSDKQLWDPESLIRIYPEDIDEGGIVNSSVEEKSYKLKSYVMYLDPETLQRYATIRSNEAVSLIEKQTQALFGNPEITVKQDGSLDTANDESVSITFSGLTLLVLEAVAFGSFLWDSENYVEAKYSFIKS